MDITNQYYCLNSEAFSARTFNLTDEMNNLYYSFLSNLKGKSILDVGCGSGRDTVHFQNLHYNVTSVERNELLANIALTNGARNVICQDIFDYCSQSKFDGIWACASLLHIDKKRLPVLFGKLYNMLNDDGVMYCSFKYGTFCGIRDGRYFVDLTEQTFAEIIQHTSFKIKQIFITEDVRDDYTQRWLNAILIK